MVKLTLDTNRDAVEDLEEALEILQEAITRRRAAASIAQGAKPAEKEPSEETAVETPFFKITVESEAEQGPTLNELLTSESLTEAELSTMFKEQVGEKPKKKKAQKEEAVEDSFIEIVEFDEEEQR